MTSWARPECRSDEIEDLINGVERYNPGNAPVIEEYLSQQIREDTYDPLANLALLKLIQFNESLVTAPDEDDSSPDTITLVLAKALAHSPFGPDFTLCMALLGDRMSSNLSTPDQIQAFKVASHLSSLLRQRDFVAFWKLLRSEETYSSSFSPALESLPSFPNLVRKSIGVTIADTFKSIEKRRAGEFLGFTDEETSKGENVDKFASEVMGWQVEGETLKIPSNEANDPKNSVQTETVDLSRMVRTLQQSIST